MTASMTAYSAISCLDRQQQPAEKILHIYPYSQFNLILKAYDDRTEGIVKMFLHLIWCTQPNILP